MINIDKMCRIVLNQQGDHMTQAIQFDCSSWINDYPNATIQIIARRPGESALYFANTTLRDGLLTWNVTNYDTYIAGIGEFQIFLNNMAGENIKRSKVIVSEIKESLQGTIEPAPTTPIPTWVDDILTSRAERFYINMNGHLMLIKVTGELQDLGKVVAQGRVATVNHVEPDENENVSLTQDDIPDGDTYVRTHNDFTDTDIQELSTNTSSIAEINAKIPAQASATNTLADKDFVNSSINNIAAFYLTRNAQGDAFRTKAELESATTYYCGGIVRVPTRNDYAIVLRDEAHGTEADWQSMASTSDYVTYYVLSGYDTVRVTNDNKDSLGIVPGTTIAYTTPELPTTRYLYNNGFEFQYVVNNSGLTAAQYAAINSGITKQIVDSTVLFTTQSLSTAEKATACNNIGAQNSANMSQSIDASSASATNYPSTLAVWNLVNPPTVVVDKTSTDITVVARPNTNYYYGDLESLNLSFVNGTQDGQEINICFFSASPATTLTIFGGQYARGEYDPSVGAYVEINAKWYLNHWVILFSEVKA